MPPFRGIVKHIILINVILFISTDMILPSLPDSGGIISWLRASKYNLAMFYPASPFFEPYQIVTHMFMHGDFNHLFFNMFAIWMFGSVLEQYWGPKRFLKFFIYTGFGAIALHLFVWYLEASSATTGAYNDILRTPVLGASGAVFGLLAGYGMKFPNSVIQLLIPPIPIKAKYFVLIYAGLELFFGISNIGAGIAHYAHVGGALFGFLIIRFNLIKGI